MHYLKKKTICELRYKYISDLLVLHQHQTDRLVNQHETTEGILNLNGGLTLVMSTKAVLFLGAPLGEEDERLVWGPSS